MAIVGADTLHHPPDGYRRAFRLLDEVDVVLVPVLDGGYSLVAATAPMAELFVGVPMGTAVVLAETQANAARSGRSVGLLPPPTTCTGSRTWPTPWPLGSSTAPGHPGGRGRATGRRPDPTP